MQSELNPAEPDARGARRILCSQIDEAAAALANARVGDEDIHNARKSLKKARATLRLLRDAIPARHYRRENRALRDAARPLSAVRDAKVMRETLQHLTKLYGPAAEQCTPAAFLRTLQREQAGTPKPPLPSKSAKDPTTLIKASRHRVNEWRVTARGWAPMGRGLKRTYGQGRKAMKQAKSAPTPECLHEWRKRTKHLWHQLQVLQPIASGEIGELADRAHKLSDYLGDHHDLAVLRDKVKANEPAFAAVGGTGALLAFIERCQRQLSEKAFRSGSRIFSKRPKQFAAGVGESWRVWQKR